MEGKIPDIFISMFNGVDKFMSILDWIGHTLKRPEEHVGINLNVTIYDHKYRDIFVLFLEHVYMQLNEIYKKNCYLIVNHPDDLYRLLLIPNPYILIIIDPNAFENGLLDCRYRKYSERNCIYISR